jgi:isocitrate dehydrogenase
MTRSMTNSSSETSVRAAAPRFSPTHWRKAMARSGFGVDTVESGFMTKDLALLISPDQKWPTTTGFLDKVDENLKRAMA